MLTILLRFVSVPTILLAARPARAQSDVVVHGVRRSHDAETTTVSAEEGSRLAGSEGDPLQALYDLPGTARPVLGSPQLIVWGSSSADTRTYIDGVEVPALFHGAALRSTVNGELVRDVTLTPGAYGADYGRGLGGIVRVETRDLSEPGLHGAAAADTLDGSAFLQAALGDRVHVAAAGRYGWIDPLLEALDSYEVNRFFAVPRYYDYQAKVQIDLRARETVDLAFLGSRDDLAQSIALDDPSLTRSQTTTTTYVRGYLRYRRAFDDGSSVEVLPWFGHDGSALAEAFGTVPANVQTSTWRGGLRAVHRSRPLPWLAATLGIEIDETSASLRREGSLEIPSREGDVRVIGQPPGPDVNTDAWTATTLDVAPHAQVDLGSGPLVVSPGIRADGFLLGASRALPQASAVPAVGLSHLDLAIEPRISVRWKVSPRLSFSVAAGAYSQPPDPADRSAVFGNPALGLASADHLTAGERLQLTGTLSLETVAFAKWMTGLTVRSPATIPTLAQALVGDGMGHGYGVQFLVRQRLWQGLSGWIAYTVSRSERRDGPGAGWRLFDGDETHVFTAVARQELGDWAVGVRLRAATGRPRTPVVGAVFDAGDNQYEPLFGPQNSTRLPAFWQIDARVDRAFALGDRGRLLVYLEGLNLTDHANAEEYTYNVSYSQRGTITGLPVLALIGMRGEM